MKHLLLALFVIISCSVVGQEKEKNKKSNGDFIINYKDSSGQGIWFSLSTADTVMSVFMVSDLDDTLTGVISGEQGNNFWYLRQSRQPIFWIKGHTAIDYSGFYAPIETYLDEKKKPLPDNIIVWQRKDRKK